MALFNENDLFTNLCLSTPESLSLAHEALKSVHTYLKENTNLSAAVDLSKEMEYSQGRSGEEDGHAFRGLVHIISEKSDE